MMHQKYKRLKQRKRSLTTIGLTALGTGLLGVTLSAKQVVQAAKPSAIGQIVYQVKHKPYAVNVWQGYGKKAVFKGYRIKDGTKWQVFYGVNDETGQRWYNLGGNQFVKAQYLTLSGELGAVNAKPELTQDKLPKTVVVNYLPGYGINVWSSPEHGQFTGTRISHSYELIVLAQAHGEDGYVWYRIGDNQWISSRYTNYPQQNPNEPSSDSNSITPGNTNSNNGSTTPGGNHPSDDYQGIHLQIQYLDEDNNNQPVGKTETLVGETGKATDFQPTIPAGYQVLTNDVPSTFPDKSTSYKVMLGHQYELTNVPETTKINFTFTGLISGKPIPSHTYDVNWSVFRDKVNQQAKAWILGSDMSSDPLSLPLFDETYVEFESYFGIMKLNSRTGTEPQDFNYTYAYPTDAEGSIPSTVKVINNYFDNDDPTVGKLKTDEVEGKPGSPFTYEPIIPVGYKLGPAVFQDYFKASGFPNRSVTDMIILQHQREDLDKHVTTQLVITYSGLPTNLLPKTQTIDVQWNEVYDHVDKKDIWIPEASRIGIPSIDGYVGQTNFSSMLNLAQISGLKVPRNVTVEVNYVPTGAAN